jgi:hypothetical protein
MKLTPTLRALRLVAPALVALAAAGCQTSHKPIDAAQARKALASTLESWKAGENPADLQSRAPAITVGDYDWEAGSKLASYEIMSSESDDGVNLHCPVKLVFKDPQGRTRESQVTYIVGTSPVITVMRDQ